ncbi:MAG: hypothetical protein O3A07_03925 [Bacteroidetes bacterium]|nr:hypothetical protein [Bacteroidota bacterium]
MKKGLLSILALAVTIVGCQNYDDQFDALNTQISALKTQVEGLSAVQSQITSLSGTLSALQATVNGLPSTSEVSSAIASELAGIIADVEALQAALETVASAEDLAAIEEALAEAGVSLENLLDSSNVYSEDLVVNSQGTLDFAVALGEKLAIVNGSVYMNVSAQMNLTDVQTVLNNIGTVVQDFSYIAGSTVSPVTFSEITGVSGNLEVSQSGAYAFEGLVSAGNIHLATGTKMTAVHFDALTTVSSINVSTLTDHGAGHGNGTVAARVNATVVTANAISGTKLAAVRLGALPYYTPGSLSITTDGEESTVDISSLASVDADGKEATLNLTIDGATAVDFSKITKGNIVASNVTDLTGGTDHDGNVTVTKVVNVVLPNLTGTFSATEKATMETFHAIGGGKGTTTITYTALDLTGFTKLTSAIVDGTFTTVTLKDNSKLTDLTYTASANTLTIDGNDDIEALAIAGKATNIVIQNNTNVVTADIDTELFAGTATTAVTAGTLTVHNNADLEALHSAFDPVDNIQVHHNENLATVDFTGTESAGAATDAVTVLIGGSAASANALSALSVVNSYDAATATTDTGSMSDEAGLSTLSTYITAATSNTSYNIKVYLDEIEEYTPAGATATATVATVDNITWADTTNNGQLKVVDLTPGTAATTTGAAAAVIGKAAWYMASAGAGALTLKHTNPVNSVVTTLVDISAGELNSNPTLAADAINADTDIAAAADVVGVSVAAYVGGEAKTTVTFGATLTATTTEGSVTAGTNSATTVATDDVLGITINGKTATGTAGAALTTSTAIAARIKDIWTTAQSTTVSNSMFDVTASSGVLTVKGQSKYGSATSGKAVSVVVGTGTSTATTPLVAYKIGYTTASTDNTTASTGLIITVTSDDAGADEGALQSGAVAATAGGATSLTASATLDVATAADAKAGTTTTATPGNTTNRLSWISGS